MVAQRKNYRRKKSTKWIGKHSRKVNHQDRRTVSGFETLDLDKSSENGYEFRANSTQMYTETELQTNIKNKLSIRQRITKDEVKPTTSVDPTPLQKRKRSKLSAYDLLLKSLIKKGNPTQWKTQEYLDRKDRDMDGIYDRKIAEKYISRDSFNTAEGKMEIETFY
jgi:hypothetical protein